MTPVRLAGGSGPEPDPDADLVRLLYEQHAGELYAYCLR